MNLKNITKIFFFFSVLLIASLALAGEAHGEHASPNITELIGLAINVIVLFGVVIYFAKGPLAKMMKERRAEAEKMFKETKKVRDAAESKLQEYTQKLDGLNDEIKRLEKEFREEGERERERVIKSAEQAAEKMVADAEAAATQELRKIQRELTEKAANMAVTIAAKLVRENINEDDRRKLISEYIDEINKVQLS